MNRTKLDRRRFLRGLGAAVGLPALESMTPLMAASTKGIASTSNGSPLRMAYLYIPNGVNLEHWKPTGNGSNYELGKSMKALEGLKGDMQIYSGLSHENATLEKMAGEITLGVVLLFSRASEPRRHQVLILRLGLRLIKLRRNSFVTRLVCLRSS